MKHQENKQTNNYFENFLNLLSTIRNAILLMLAFYAMAFTIDSITQESHWCDCGSFRYICIRRTVEIETAKTTAYSIGEMKKNYDYTESPFKQVRKWNPWAETCYHYIQEPPQVSQPQLLRWKSWENHRARMKGILGY